MKLCFFVHQTIAFASLLTFQPLNQAQAMFHLLSEYAKLLKYKPTKPPKAVELCAESMACPAKGLERKFMMESMVKAPHSSAPCSLPPPYNPAELRLLQRRKANSIKQVEIWEQRAWESKSN